jgi:hypothetical protein
MLPHPLTLDPSTVAFNGAMLAVDALALVVVARDRGPMGVLAALLLVSLASTVLALGVALSFSTIFIVIQFAAWALFLHGQVLLTGSAFLLWRTSRVLGVVAAGLGAMLALIALDAFVVEPTNLEVAVYQVVSPKVRQPTRVLVMADFQTDVIGDYERDVVLRAMGLKPDLVLMAGDYLQQRDPQLRTSLARELRRLLEEAGFSAPMGIYAVGGDVDPPGWPDLFDGLPVTSMELDQTRDVADWLTITGLTLPSSRRGGYPVPKVDGFHIVLGHAPDFAIQEADADLLVAGHTHGGQVQLPFYGPLITMTRAPRAWAAGGLTPLDGGRALVVSRGIGLERDVAPRLRFLCRPQLVVVDLEPVAG